MTNSLLKVTLLAFAVVASMCAIQEAASAQTGVQNAGVKADIGIVTTVTPRPGKQLESRGSSVSDDLFPGESSRFYVGVGEEDAPCAFISGAGNWSASHLAEQQASVLHFWQFDVKVVSVTIDAITFDLSWVRTSRTSPQETMKETVRFQLREGERRPIDLIHGPSASDCVNVMLETTAHVREEVALANKIIDWDLWLVRDAQSAPVHTRLSSLQGEEVRFVFEPAMKDNAWLHVYGEIRGRMLSNGTIDVGLSAHRMMQTGSTSADTRLPGRLLRMWGGEAGRKSFNARPGEAVKITMPAYQRSGPSPVSHTIDPVTGQKKTTVTLEPSGRTPSVVVESEISLTVQARIR